MELLPVMRSRARLAATLATLLALAPALALPVLAAPVAPAAAAEAAPAADAPPKVVIVVGATHEATASYRSYGDLFYAEAIKYTPNVVKVYSPNATWKNVKAAAQGASILIYLGHGSGYPKSTSAVFDPNNHDGMGLNSATNPSDNVAKYYGESYMANDIRLAKNAVVILSHLCYASGNSESGDPEPTYAVARERIDNFASGFLRAGARTVIADVWNSGVVSYIRSIFTTDQTIGNMWATSPSNHGHQMAFTPLRNPAYQAVMDPNTWSSGFYRSIVGALEMRTTAVVNGAGAAPTWTDPTGFLAPGAATVGSASVPLYDDPALAAPTGASLPAAAKLRVGDVQSAPVVEGGSVSPPAVHVTAMSGGTAGWASGAGLLPRDSAGPNLWSVDGATTISPNFDGLVDRLNLVARFSETATWNASIRDADGDEVRSQAGGGHQAFITWDALSGADPAPEGEYTWHLDAWDAWGNEALAESGTFTIVHQPTPESAVLSFVPSATTTRSSTINYTLTFAGPVTGLSKADLRRTGTASGCNVGTPAGGPTQYAIQVTDCTTGTVTLTLSQGTVIDTASTPGPVGSISAPKVTIDRTDPSVAQPRAALRAGVALGSSATNAPLPMLLTWSATDAGAGVKSYDVKRSYDGGTYERVGSGITAASLSWTFKPGHSYQFKVRARDKAGNVSAWVGASTWTSSLVQQSSSSVKWTGAWTTDSDAAFSGGSARAATAPGATASLTFSGRSVAWVTTREPTNGTVQVWVDGALAATVDTFAESTTERFVAFTRSWTSYGSHTIKLVVVGTADRPQVVVDAFEVIH
jgi:hypothetical protein